MNMYSTDIFLRTLGEIYLAGRRCEPAFFSVEGRVYRLLTVDGAPVTQWMFVDFFEPVPDPTGPVRPIGYLPSVAHETLSADDWRAHPPIERVTPAPFIDWKCFRRWEDFVSGTSSRTSRLFSHSRRKRNNLAKALGDLEFRLDDRRPETLALGLAWKSAQYRATGQHDLFEDAKNRRLFTDLAARDLVFVSSLSAGGRVVAVHIGASHDRRLYSWIPSYDREVARFSPGRLTLEWLLRASFERGDWEFDFLLGGEAYKWHYASHARVIGSAGRPPLSLRLERGFKRGAKQALRRMPWLLDHSPWLKERALR